MGHTRLPDVERQTGILDLPFLGLTVLLTALGLVMIYSASYARALYETGDSAYFFKRQLVFALVGIGHILDTQVIGAGSVLRTAVIFFYLSNEGVSLIENAGHLGLPIPKKLKAVLEQLHDRAEKEDEKHDDE